MKPPRALRRLSTVPARSFAGKALRMPLRLIPKELVVPILFGPLRGSRWTVGAGNHSCWLGVYEHEKQHEFVTSIHAGSTIFDVGAHAGFYTLLFARLVGWAGTVVAFEPSSRNLAFLRRHIALNQAHNVRIVGAAVADSSGEALFAEGESSYNGSLSSTGSVTVRKLSIDDYCRDEGAPIPDVIKIDVEGAEDSVLAGCVSILRSRRPIIFLATHSAELEARCTALLESLGYEIQDMTGDPLEWREVVARPRPEKPNRPRAHEA